MSCYDGGKSRRTKTTPSLGDFLVCHGHGVCPWMPFPGVQRVVGQSPCYHARNLDWQETSACMYTTSAHQHQRAHLAIPLEAPSWDDLTLFIRIDTHKYRSELVRPRPRLHAVVPRALEDVLPAFGMYRPSARP